MAKGTKKASKPKVAEAVGEAADVTLVPVYRSHDGNDYPAAILEELADGAVKLRYTPTSVRSPRAQDVIAKRGDGRGEWRLA